MQSKTLAHAKVLWDFMLSVRETGDCETIVVCCSYDLRVCEYACKMLLRQHNDAKLLFSGNTGRWTKHLWSVTEAEVFRNYAISQGISESRLLVETEATNIGENISFSRKIISTPGRIAYISKPNTLMRLFLTVPIHDHSKNWFVTSPPIVFPEQVSNVIGLFGLISEMVGDIERIMNYPSKGFQKAYEIPEEVIRSYEVLLQAGFTHNMM